VLRLPYVLPNQIGQVALKWPIMCWCAVKKLPGTHSFTRPDGHTVTFTHCQQLVTLNCFCTCHLIELWMFVGITLDKFPGVHWDCDELTVMNWPVWHTDCVMIWPCDKLTGNQRLMLQQRITCSKSCFKNTVGTGKPSRLTRGMVSFWLLSSNRTLP